MTVEPIRHVYVHAPFCARRCVYCDFAVDVNREPDGDLWQATIETELATLTGRGDVTLASSLATLFVGGGTPSVLDPARVVALGGVLGMERLADPELEWTVEANPESFSTDVAGTWARGGVNRISLGVQSFDSDVLRWMGRLHSATDATSAVRRARDAGISNLSIDLIFGLPESIERSWPDDLEGALGLDVPHVSLYGLTVESGTPLARQVAEGRTPHPEESRYRDEYLTAVDVLSGAGYEHYEVSNFARPGYAARHNQAYWRHVPYLGLGNGAHSYYRGRRWWNERDWTTFARRVADGGSGRTGNEALSADQVRLEATWLGLRTREGVSCDRLDESGRALAASWETKGLAHRDGGRLRLTPDGWLILDQLTVELDATIADTSLEGTR